MCLKLYSNMQYLDRVYDLRLLLLLLSLSLLTLLLFLLLLDLDTKQINY